MAGRESKAFGMRTQIGHSEGPGVGDEKAEHPSPRWASADSLLVVGCQSHRDEFGQTGTVVVEHAESGVAGTCHGPGLLDNVA